MTISVPVPSVASRETKFAVLLTASLISSLIMLDSNIVAVSLPAIARSLGATFADIEWVVNAYVLTFAALLLAAGSFADRHGRKRAILAGLAIFTVASGLCGFSSSALMLNLARALQGIGASLLLTAALAIIKHAFPAAERARAYAFWGACLGVAITGGPIAGGAITDFLGWRWAFLINLPVGAALILAAMRVISESNDPDAKRLDLAGIATFSSGLFLLIWALIDGNTSRWGSQSVLARLGGAAFLLCAFVAVELRQDRPMVDFTLFRQRTFLGSAFAMVGYAAGAQVLIFFLPMFLQNSYGFTPAAAGFAMLPFALPMLVAPRFGAGLARHHSGRALLTLGLLITLAGDLLLCLFAWLDATYAVTVVGMLLAGTGAGLLNSETAKAMQTAVPSQRAGMASGIGATVRFVGLLVGVAGLGAALSRTISHQFMTMSEHLGLGHRAATAVAQKVAAGQFGAALASVSESLQPGLHAAASAAFARGFAAVSLSAAVVAGIAAACAFLLVRHSDTAPIAEESAPSSME